MKLGIILLLFTMLAITTTHCQVVDNTSCPPGLEKCGDRCFDRLLHQCFDGEFLCPQGHFRCGNSCYRPSQYQCGPGFILVPQYGSCGGSNSGLVACGGSCYNPQEYDCFNGFLCPKGTRRCGDACYNPTQYYCRNDDASLVLRSSCGTTTTTCPSDQACCPTHYGGRFCFEPVVNGQEYYCVPATNTPTISGICPVGTQGCGIRSVGVCCYNPTTEYCSSVQFGAICNKETNQCRTSC